MEETSTTEEEPPSVHGEYHSATSVSNESANPTTIQQTSDQPVQQVEETTRIPTPPASSTEILSSIHKTDLETVNVIESFKEAIESGKQGEELRLEIEANRDPQDSIASTVQNDPSKYRRLRTVLQRSQVCVKMPTFAITTKLLSN